MLLAMMMGCAISEAEQDIRCWTSNADNRYHMEKTCAGDGSVPISEKAALAFGKEPCEKCVVVEKPKIVYDSEELSMATRAGTYILCIPVSSMESTAALPELDWVEKWSFTGEEIEGELRNILAENAYDELMKCLKADGWAYGSCRVPELMLEEDVLFMSKRLIGEEWYFVLRPAKSYGAEINLKWRVDEWEIQMESHEALDLLKNRSDERANTLPIAVHNGAKVIFEKNYGQIDVTVYRHTGINTVVLRDSSSNKDVLTGVLIIGGADTGTVLNGYLDSRGKATYCCVISDTELGDIVAGKIPQICYELQQRPAENT